MITRRSVIRLGSSALAASAALLARTRTRAALPETPGEVPPSTPDDAAATGDSYTPVVTPNGATLPFHYVGDTKVFHLVAEPLRHQLAPGLEIDAWGYNGRTPGPTIEVVQGDHVRIYVTNRLPEPTSVHWHGIILPNGMDGVAGLTQRAIPPGETFKYELTFRYA